MAAVVAGAVTAAAAPAAADYPFHQDPTQLAVTRGDRVVRQLPCERIALDGNGRWGNTHIRGQAGRTSDGTIHAQVGGAYGAYWVVGKGRNVMFASTDEGRTWTGRNVDLPKKRIIGALAVLSDDAFLAAATEPGDARVSFYRSTDRGKTWQQASEVTPDPCKIMSIDGNLLQLADGRVLSVLHFAVPASAGKHFSQGIGLQYVLRSTDGGRTWQGGPDPALLKPLIEAWGGAPADNVGRIFRQVMFSRSTDAGLTWATMKPFADADGKPVIIQQETNGQLVPLGDGRLVLVHQRRSGPIQLIARLSEDNGKTWSRDEYRLSAGFGYSGNLVLKDGTILTVTGKSLGGTHAAQVIRWRPPER